MKIIELRCSAGNGAWEDKPPEPGTILAVTTSGFRSLEILTIDKTDDGWFIRAVDHTSE